MQNVKILSALMFGLVGFWAFSLVSEGEATHILISQTAAIPDGNGGYVLTFTLDNQGAPDRLIAASSPDADATLANELAIPSGTTEFTREAAWLTVASQNQGPRDIGIQLEFEQSGTVSAVIRAAGE